MITMQHNIGLKAVIGFGCDHWARWNFNEKRNAFMDGILHEKERGCLIESGEHLKKFPSDRELATEDMKYFIEKIVDYGSSYTDFISYDADLGFVLWGNGELTPIKWKEIPEIFFFYYRNSERNVFLCNRVVRE